MPANQIPSVLSLPATHDCLRFVGYEPGPLHWCIWPHLVSSLRYLHDPDRTLDMMHLRLRAHLAERHVRPITLLDGWCVTGVTHDKILAALSIFTSKNNAGAS